MSQFTTLALSGERVLVAGTDSQGHEGQVVLDASEWNEVKRITGTTQAQQDFDAAVEEFFKPITDAAEKLHVSFSKVEQDPISYVTIDEGEEASCGRRPNIIKLSKDSIILRLLEQGDDDRLVWVHDTLEVLEVLPGTSTVEAKAEAEANAEVEFVETDAEG